jgi:hypothetical protein
MKKHIDENGFTVNEGHAEIDWSFLDMGGKLDNAQADASFGVSPDLRRHLNRERTLEMADDFEELVER